MSEGVQGKIFKVSKAVIIRHERVLIKQLVLISSEAELMQGPFEMFPCKTVQIPAFVSAERIKNESSSAYKMVRTDPFGERKVSTNGELQNGRSYLMETFTLSSSPQIFVLISDLIEVLQYEGSDEEFLREYPQLLPLSLNDDERAFLKSEGLVKDENTQYITAKSAFVQFGAAIIVSGLRVVDDYWETIAKEQGFTPHHRVFKLSKRLHNILTSLKPSIQSQNGRRNDDSDVAISGDQTHIFESPYATVSEQVSIEIRQEYGREFSNGEHSGVVVPGQNINGGLELSSRFKVPKYHSKNSFQQALQANAMDTPIDSPSQTLTQQQVQPQPSLPLQIQGQGQEQQAEHQQLDHCELPHSQQPQQSQSQSQPPQPQPQPQPQQEPYPINGVAVSPGSYPSGSKSGKRLLNSILDTGNHTTIIKNRKSEENDLIKLTTEQLSSNDQLNINGWKFESLPLKADADVKSPSFSRRGLPFLEKERLIKRLKLLTPNQVKEIEHLHDSLLLNTGIQNLRKLRAKKWTKYWQYKTGIPVGLRKCDLSIFENQYLKEILEQTTSVTTYNETTNMDEITITKRIPNANFLGHSNIHGFKPPYANSPNGGKR